MKTRSNISILLSAALAMIVSAGCSSDVDDDNRVLPIVLTSSMGTTPISRAVSTDLQSTQIVAGTDNVGVWILEDTKDKTPVYVNKAYSTDGSGNLTTSENAYFPIDGTFVSMFACVPRQDVGSDITTFRFSVPTSQTTEEDYLSGDLLIGAPQLNHIAKTPEKVNLVFLHKMAKIVLDFTSADNSVIGQAITTCNLYTAVNCNMKTGEVTTDTETTTSITTVVDDNKKAMILIPEQTIAVNVQLFTMTLNGTPIYYVPASDITFEAGKVYTYTMSVTTTSILITPDACVLSEWGSGNSICLFITND